MSATSTGPGVSSRGVTAGGAAVNGDDAARPPGRDTAGRLLGLLSVLPVLVAMAWLLVGLPLLLAGHFTPVLTLVLAVLLAVVLVFLGLRWIPGRWPGTLPEAAQGQARTPWWPLIAVLAVAVGFGIERMVSTTPSRSSSRSIRLPTCSSGPGSPTTGRCPSRRTAPPSAARTGCSASAAPPSTRSATVSCRSSWRGCRWCSRPVSGPAGPRARSWSRRSWACGVLTSVAWRRGSSGRGGHRWPP